MSYAYLSTSYCKALASYSRISEPTSFAEAASHPRWVEALKAKITVFEENHIWISIIELPPDKHAIHWL